MHNDEGAATTPRPSTPPQHQAPRTDPGLVAASQPTPPQRAAGTFGGMENALAGLFISSAPSERPPEPNSPTRGGTRNHTVASPSRPLDWRDHGGPSVPVLTPRSERRRAQHSGHTLATSEIKVERQPAPGVTPPRATQARAQSPPQAALRPTGGPLPRQQFTVRSVSPPGGNMRGASPPHHATVPAPKVGTVPGINNHGQGRPQHSALHTPERVTAPRRGLTTPAVPRDLALNDAELRFVQRPQHQPAQPIRHHSASQYEGPSPFRGAGGIPSPQPTPQRQDAAQSPYGFRGIPSPLVQPQYRGGEKYGPYEGIPSPATYASNYQHFAGAHPTAEVIAAQALSSVDAAQARYSFRRQVHMTNRSPGSPAAVGINAIPTAIPL
jgi:hypothetical protein